MPKKIPSSVHLRDLPLPSRIAKQIPLRGTRKLIIESLEHREMLAITIFAAGETGSESMDLLIDSVVVQSWTNIGGNASTRTFQPFVYNGASNVNPDRIRVAFTNDLFEDGVLDRNLVVDRIVVDATTYQTEAPTVFSTGTWLPQDGVQSGFRESETLHTSGYFQYAVNSGSLIQILAAGQVGQEAMALRIDGREVFRWSDVGGNAANGDFNEFIYRAPDKVQAKSIQVAFTNDRFAPPIDHNLRVDKIIVDGVTYQTESPSVFSTGTYRPEIPGVRPGFWQSEWLNSNGYFAYDAQTAKPGTLGIEATTYQANEGDASIAIAVVRRDGSDGTVGISYATGNNTAIAGSDYSATSGVLTFLPGETRKTVTIPLRNDTVAEAREQFNFVLQFPTGGAVLLAPRTTTIDIVDNDFTLPNLSSFTPTSTIRVNGSASIADTRLNLTPLQTNTLGSAYFATPIPLIADSSFQTQFQFRVGGGTTGGDGFTFVLQNATAGLSALGSGGGNLGYQGIFRSLAIEFDTFRNTNDIDNNHVSVWRNGNMSTALVTRSSTIDFNSGNNLNAWIDYNGLRDLLEIYVSSGSTKPNTPLASTTVDLVPLLGNTMYAGFTAASGGARNQHQILKWSMTQNRPEATLPNSTGNLIDETLVGGLSLPTAIDFTPDGSMMLIAEKGGVVKSYRNGQLASVPFIDIAAQVNSQSDRGLLGLAIHPNFPATPYVYLYFVYDPPEVFQNATDEFAGPDRPGNRTARLIRVTANAATNFTTAISGSETILLGKNGTWANLFPFANFTSEISTRESGRLPDGSFVQDFINMDSESHAGGSLAFGPDGALYVTTGDGASYNTMDPRAIRVQNIDSLSGKILRIDPLTGNGLATNPFAVADLTSNRSKVYQLGFRNPFRMAIHPQTGQLFTGDVGWFQWEEVNSGGAGANLGWPYYEGGNATNLRTVQYETLPSAIAFYGSGRVATPPIYALNHAADNINAIVMGTVYTGSTYPEKYRNNLFFNDLGQGIVRAASLAADGSVATVETFALGATYVVQIIQGKDGNLYYVDLDDGVIGRWRFATTSGATVARTVASTATSLNATSRPVTGGASGLTHAAASVGSPSIDSSRTGGLDRVEVKANRAWEVANGLAMHGAKQALAAAKSVDLDCRTIAKSASHAPMTKQVAELHDLAVKKLLMDWN